MLFVLFLGYNKDKYIFSGVPVDFLRYLAALQKLWVPTHRLVPGTRALSQFPTVSDPLKAPVG